MLLREDSDDERTANTTEFAHAHNVCYLESLVHGSTDAASKARKLELALSFDETGKFLKWMMDFHRTGEARSEDGALAVRMLESLCA